MKKDYLYIFAHVPKTGGTSYAKFLKKNLKADEILVLDYKKLGVDPDSGEDLDYKKIVFDYLSKIPLKKRSKIKLLTGHIVPYGVHKFFSQKSRYVTLLRDPVERVISLYNYFKGLYEREGFLGKKKKLYRNIFLVNGKPPSFYEWLDEKFGDKTRVFSLGTQSDYFGVLDYALDKFYFVGTIDDLNKKHNLTRENASQKYITGVSGREMNLIKAKTRKDVLIYGLLK